jgi:GNAT superfamily N-acetyltransferase
MNVTFRDATRFDLGAIVAMLADDVLGAVRERYEDPLPDSYTKAFAAIEADRNTDLIVGCVDDEVVAVLQCTYTPNLSYQGSWRAIIEGVRTAAKVRGQGIGAKLVSEAIERARVRRCIFVQLTSDARRADARRFYERLGFVASHVGMKLRL